jgi:nucleoside-triphosphatase THEP1
MTAVRSHLWQRAAVYGSLWASIEIVLGSFLHNLRAPLAGSLLTAIGVMLMTAAHRARPERGLIWRAALVCALMKSVSPSAVILGPMVGILMEGVLLETAVRLAAGRAPGYLVGGALAVSWTIAQRILNAVIQYGPDVVRLYVDAYRYAARTLGISSFGPLDLVATLVGVEMAVGVAAAAGGLRVARQPIAPLDSAPVGRPASGPAPIVAQGHWSIPRLVLVSVALVGGMAGIGALPLWGAALLVAAFAAFVLVAYPGASRRLARPSLWIELAGLVLFAGLVFGGIHHGLAGLADGAVAGGAMVLRATMVILGFTAISVELRNPAILAAVERHRLKGLSDALGVAFGTLPAFTAALAEAPELWRHPRRLVRHLLQVAEALARQRTGRTRAGETVILTGETGSGKTTLVLALVERLRAGGLQVAGIVAPGMLHHSRRSGFDVVDLRTGERRPLSREANVEGSHARWSRFAFLPEGLSLGAEALGDSALDADVIVVDEVGPFELSGGGWAGALDALAARYDGVMLIVVRRSVVDAVRSRWGAGRALVFDANTTTPEDLASCLSNAAAERRQVRGRVSIAGRGARR